MSPSLLVWGSPAWFWAAVTLAAAGLAALAWGYWHAPAAPPWKLVAGLLKALALAALALVLVEPLLSGTRVRPGANLFAVLADNSQSMTIEDRGPVGSRGATMQALLAPDARWQARLTADFDARRFVFDANLRAVDDFSSLSLDGSRTALSGALGSVARRFRGLPLAGVLLVTDGNATDMLDAPWAELPPVYPVMIGADEGPPDLSVADVSVSQTNFESAPVTVRAEIAASGFAGQNVAARLVDEDGKEVARQIVAIPGDGGTASVRFQLRPERAGVNFLRVVVGNEDAAKPLPEATTANNERMVVVDRGGGPYRVLYVCGRLNWEFKFLRRALEEDDQLELVGIVRIAKREPKFTFRGRAGESTNPLFRGFDHPDAEDAERYDQPVLLRLGTRDEHELHDGFPKTAEELYHYDAVILDDLEAEFFTQDQLVLLEQFVSRRGGGFLMLGGPDSFAAGRYDRTPVANVLPVYVDAMDRGRPAETEGQFRLALTRDGWLQPWVRTRTLEPEERARLAAMPSFRSLSRVGHVKPAAAVLAEVVDPSGREYPALVTQRYGNGRSAAMLVGDMWRWDMRRTNERQSELAKSWRQTVRWLVADVPRRVEVDVGPASDSQPGALAVRVHARDPEFMPLDNAQVVIAVTTPDGKQTTLDVEPDASEAGAYAARPVPQQPGAYRMMAKVVAPDGSSVGEREAGWVAQPAAEEFRRLPPNRPLLEEIAAKTGGRVLAADELDRFFDELPGQSAPINEPWSRPAWHHPVVYFAIIVCLVGEWGLRRWKGLA